MRIAVSSLRALIACMVSFILFNLIAFGWTHVNEFLYPCLATGAATGILVSISSEALARIAPGMHRAGTAVISLALCTAASFVLFMAIGPLQLATASATAISIGIVGAIGGLFYR